MAGKSKKLFREVSLERLSSPDQLDQLMRVTSLREWIAATALILAIALAVAWSILGSIPTQVQGQAVFLRSGGLESVTTSNPGRISDVSVAVGEQIRQGQVIARIAQPEVLEQINALRNQLGELESQRRWLTELLGVQADLQEQFVIDQRQNIRAQIRILEQRLDAQRDLVADGLITRQEFLQTERELADLESQFQQVDISEFETRRDIETQVETIQREIREVESRLSRSLVNLQEQAEVRSPHSGQIVEVLAVGGQVIGPGERIVTLQRTGRTVKSLEAVIYIPARDGKRVNIGMDVQLSPGGVRREEFGYLRGWVTGVSEFAVSSDGMSRLLQNETLVQDLLAGGSVFEVRVDLFRDPSTPSGFAWTSGVGPPIQIDSGNIGDGRITVQRQRPIALVIPLLREWTGL